MDGTPTIGSVLGFVLSGGASVYALLVAAVGFIIWKRTHSSHILMNKLWAVFHGNKECTVQPVADFLNEQEAIHRFRFTTGIRVRNLKQVEKLKALAQQDEHALPQIAAASDLFDLEKMEVKERTKLPRMWRLIAAALLIALLSWLLAFSAGAMFIDRAVVRMKDTGTWFLLDEHFAKPLFVDASGFKLSACAQPTTLTTDVTGFTISDMAAICKVASATSLPQYVDTTVGSQRWVLAIALGFLLYITSEAIGWLKRVTCAIALGKRQIAWTLSPGGSATS